MGKKSDDQSFSAGGRPGREDPDGWWTDEDKTRNVGERSMEKPPVREAGQGDDFAAGAGEGRHK
jgi:hypothetical protein